MKIYSLVTAFVCTLISVSSFSLTPINDSELAQAAIGSRDLGLFLSAELTNLNDGTNVDEDTLKQMLQKFANTFGLTLREIQIEGMTKSGKFELYCEENGKTIAVAALPDHIDHIRIGAITIGQSPASLGRVDIRNIDSSGYIVVNRYTDPQYLIPVMPPKRP